MAELAVYKNHLDVINNEISIATKDNMINGVNLDQFIYNQFLNRIDPIEYCENVLRAHLTDDKRKLHENQTSLIRAVCNPNFKQVAGMMSRQCIRVGSIIHTRDGALIPIEISEHAWRTKENTEIYCVTTIDGNSVYCTHNHPFYTKEGWKKCEELTPRDFIACLHKWDKFGNITNNNMAEFLGYITICNSNEDSLFNTVRNNKDRFKELLNILAKSCPNKEEYKGTTGRVLFVKEKALVKQYSIPYILNDFSKESIIVFLQTLLKTYLTDNKMVFKYNRTLAEFIKELFTKLGIYKSSLHEEYKNNIKYIYLQFENLDEIQNFLNGILPNINNNPNLAISEENEDNDGEILEFTKIHSITLDNKANVYDITFEGKGWFICNGMKVHNSGKCFAKGTKILMANGKEKNVEEIKVGDKVMSPNSTPCTVTSLGHGVEEMYEIKSKEKNHESFTVNKSHILSLISRKHKVTNITVEEYLKLSKSQQNGLYGYRKSVEFEEKEIDIDPYFLGLWIGDGCKNYTTITNSDKEVVAYLDNYAKELGCVCFHSRIVNNHIVDHTIRLQHDSLHIKNPLWRKMVKMNLLGNKHVPDIIMYNSMNIRRKFLAGLIDSNGCCFNLTKTTEIAFVNETLAYQILKLCRSLGFKSNIKEKIVKFNGKNFKTWRIHLYGDLSVIPILVERKKNNNKIKNNPLVFNFDVIPKGIGEYYGFTIDSEDHLFLLGDYTVTHNTESIASFSGYLIDNYPNMKVGIFTPRLQQAEVSIGRLSTFFQMNEDKLNHKIVKITKDKVELDNNSYVVAVSASDQSNIEGLTFDVIILDEAQKVSDYTFSERIVPMGGGCVIGNSLITLFDGSTKTIEEIVKNKNIKYIPCLDTETNKTTMGEIVEYHDTGIYDTIKITLINGQEICGTYDHPVLVSHRKTRLSRNPHWETLQDVKEDYSIGVPTKTNFFGTKNVQFARLIGMVIGDGSCSHNSVMYGSEDVELIDYINTTPYKFHCNTNGNFTTKKGKLYQKGNILNFIEVMKTFKLNGLTGINKTLPYNYYEWNKESLRELIAGLFDTDGSIVIEDNRRCRIEISSICHNIILDIKIILKKFGINAISRKRLGKSEHYILGKKVSCKDYYILTINDKESVENFYNNFKLLVKHKQETLIKGVEILSCHKHKIAKELLDKDIRMIKVQSIEHIPQQHVYDLTVHNVPCYNVTEENIKENNIKITLNSGKEIIAHENYKVLSYINNEMVYIPMQDIKEKQYIGVPNKLFNLGDYYEKHARIFGMLIGDGNYSSNDVQFSNTEKILWEYLEQELGQENIRYSQQKPTKDGKILINGGINKFKPSLEKIGIWKQKSDSKTLPNNYKEYNLESMCELIGGLFDTDGSIGIYNNKPSITYTTISKHIFEGIRFMLEHIGVHIRFDVREEEVHEFQNYCSTTKPLYKIIIEGKENIVNFYNNIKLLTYKQQKLNECYDFVKNSTSHTIIKNDIRFEKVKHISYIDKKEITCDKKIHSHSFIANNIFVHNTNAKIIQIGTPKTKNHFYDAVEGKASNKWVVIKRDWTQCAQSWALGAIYLPDPKTGIERPYSRFILEQAMPKILKQEMFPDNPEVWTEGNLSVEDFRTQYMLEFIDGAGKFLDSQEIKTLTDGDFDWLDHGEFGEFYFAGIDFAGSNPDGDSTQISVFRLCKDGQRQKVFAKELNNMTYPQQMYEIGKLFGGYSPRFEVKKICADYTGCGAPVIQFLKDEYGITNIEGIIFNQTDKYTHSGMNMKNLMYGNFKTALNNGKIKYPSKQRFMTSSSINAGTANLPYYHRMISEWSDLEATITHSVNKKIEAPIGYHDDVPDSDVLAFFASTKINGGSSMPRPTYARIYR